MKSNYIFTSERLGFRNWVKGDYDKMIRISSDPDVMEHFPATATPEQTIAFIEKMKQLFEEKNYCYFATEEIESGDFVGFIGLAHKKFKADFTPCVDIGWRLAKKYWGKGYATEGAKRCLSYGFKEMNIDNIKSTAPLVNRKSIRVMEKIGMRKQMEFKHPLLLEYKRLVNCVCYEIDNPS